MLHPKHEKEWEQKASSYHQDGLLDIAMGTSILLVGLFLRSEAVQSLIPIYAVLWLPLVKTAKRLITAPRMPFVLVDSHPYAQRKKQIIQLTISMIVILLLALGLLVFLNPGSSTATFVTQIGGIYGMISLLMAVILAFAGWVNGINRFIGYVALALTTWLLGLWTGYSFTLLVLLGVIILLPGVFLLGQFLHRYPLPHEKGHGSL